MPNWTYNRMTFENEKDFNKVVKECVVDGHFDFNTVVPMPKLLEDTESGTEEMRVLEFAKDKQDIPENIVELYAKENDRDLSANSKRRLANSLKCLKLYGIADWYDWACKYWGTKWNAQNTEIDDFKLTISFYTAWAAPGEFYEAFAKKYPEISCEVYAQNEDAGEDYGVYDISIEDGDVVYDAHGLSEEELAELRG